MHAALDEDGQHGRADDPRRLDAHAIEQLAVRARLGLEQGRVALHVGPRDAEAVDHLEEELGVWRAGNDSLPVCSS